MTATALARARAVRVPPSVLATTTVLFTVMVAHALLETARDALFLARLGPERLAWAYLGIAGSALLAFVALRRWAGLRDPRRLLLTFLFIAVAGTATLAATITLSSSLVFVLYVWTGLVATLVVPSFWTLIDRSLPVDEAKRVFAGIVAGGVLGALVGSALAAVLGRLVAPRHLVTAGALVFALAALAAITLAPHPADDTPPHLPRRHLGGVSRRTRHYVRLLVAAGVISTVALTLGDLAFKRVVSERLPAADLATAFGTIYTGLNILSLAVQLFIAPRLLARLGVGTALMVMPLMMAATALGFALTAAMASIILLKLGDGGLRHSLHRVTSEILFLPVPAGYRDGAKPIADTLSQRGGQVLAVLLVLATASVPGGGSSGRLLAAMAAVAALAWLTATVFTRAAYVAQFRDMLAAGDVQRDVRLPELDAASVELLTEALASPDEVEALAALELLARAPDRIPALVLYHPSRTVVRRALRLLDNDTRAEVTAVIDHLLDHADPEIRADALAVSSWRGRHRPRLNQALTDPHPDVRAAAVVGLLGDAELGPAAAAELAAMLAGSTTERVALAHAIGHAPDERLRATLAGLLAHHEVVVMREVLEVYARAPELADLTRLLGLLEDPRVRGDVRRVFLAADGPGLDLLIAALDDPATPVAVRRHLPRTMSRFGSARAATALVGRLPHEPDGTTEFKILRALGRMRVDDPDLPIDEAPLRRYLQRSVSQAARFATYHDYLRGDDEPTTAGLTLLRELIAEKRDNAVARAFRTLGILHPRADLRSLHDALTGTDASRRGAAREVAEAVVDADTRTALFAVLDDLSPKLRRDRLGELAPGPFMTHEEFVTELLRERSESLRCVVAHHIGERRLQALRPTLAQAQDHGASPIVRHAFDQAIARLDDAA